MVERNSGQCFSDEGPSSFKFVRLKWLLNGVYERKMRNRY